MRDSCGLLTIAISLLVAVTVAASPPSGLIPSIERELIQDGSFEWGDCAGGSAWTCEADGGCEMIMDLVPLGLWNYDGMHTAWIGGFCDGIPVANAKICQELLISSDTLSWYMLPWNYDYNQFRVKIDGDVVHLWTPPIDHLLDYRNYTADVSDYVGSIHEVCFDYDPDYPEYGGSYFVDYVELLETVGVEQLSFSTVKSLY